MKVNVAKPAATTHEGARAYSLGPEVELQRSVTSCLLWEDSFYESGEDAAARIKRLIPLCRPEFVAGLAIMAREQMKLRHVPLLLVREMARLASHKHLVSVTLESVIQRADELTEFLAIYWREGRQPLSAQVKKGLAKAFRKFGEHALAKYDGDGAVKLRDALFLSHSKPKDATIKFTKVERKSKTHDYTLTEHEALYKRVVDRTLAVPDTWEVELSGGADKAKTFTHLMLDEKLGALAFLRNLRNMHESGVDKALVGAYMDEVSFERVLPFRFIAAARAVPAWEDLIERGMLRCTAGMEKFSGHTVLLIDGSGSMQSPVSANSEITRRDAACALAIILRETCEDVRVIGFSDNPWDIQPRRGFALRDAIAARVHPVGTLLGRAVRYAQQKPCDRIIVITDEQSQDAPPEPTGTGYVINVAGFWNGVGYGPWVHSDCWSESVLTYIRQYEATL